MSAGRDDSAEKVVDPKVVICTRLQHPSDRGMNRLIDSSRRQIRRTASFLGFPIGRYEVKAVSFPKSGRTWVEVMVARVYELLTGIPVAQLVKNKPRMLIDRVSRKRLRIIRHGHGTRFRHFVRDGVFPRDDYRGLRVALQVRDPRDVLVSNYYYHKYQHQAFTGSMHDFIRFPYWEAEPDTKLSFAGIDPIINYYNAWIENQDVFSSFLVIRYEDFHTDPLGTLGELFDFANVAVSDEQLADAIEYASFDNMRNMETSQKLEWIGLPGANDRHGLKTRRGQVGGYREELQSEDLAYVDRAIRERLSPFFHAYRESIGNHDITASTED
jgi:hypothetical protein